MTDEKQDKVERLPKSGKREVALGIVLVALSFAGLAVHKESEMAMRAFEILIYPALLMLSAALGLHSLITQAKLWTK